MRVKAQGGGSPRYIEGLADARWVLLDYGQFVVHVFVEEAGATTTSSARGRCWPPGGDSRVVPRRLASGPRCGARRQGRAGPAAVAGGRSVGTSC